MKRKRRGSSRDESLAVVEMEDELSGLEVNDDMLSSFLCA